MKYIKLYNDIKSSIRNGDFSSVNKLPEMEEMVKKYGVSITTVFRAIQLLKREGLVRAVRGKGLFATNSTAESALSLEGKNRVLLMFPEYAFNTMNSEVFRKVLRAVEITCDRNKLDLILVPQRNRSDYLCIKAMEEERASGIILFDVNSSELLNGLKEKKIPTVVCFAWNPSVDIDQVCLDHFAISGDIFKKCKSLNKSEVVFIGSIKGNTSEDIVLSHHSWEIALRSQATFTEQVKFSAHYIYPAITDSQKLTIKEILKKQGNSALFVAATQRIGRVLIEQAAEIEIDYTKELSVIMAHSWTHDKIKLHGREIVPYALVWDAFSMGEKAVDILRQRINRVSMKTQRILFSATISPVENLSIV